MSFLATLGELPPQHARIDGDQQTGRPLFPPMTKSSRCHTRDNMTARYCRFEPGLLSVAFDAGSWDVGSTQILRERVASRLARCRRAFGCTPQRTRWVGSLASPAQGAVSSLSAASQQAGISGSQAPRLRGSGMAENAGSGWHHSGSLWASFSGLPATPPPAGRGRRSIAWRVCTTRCVMGGTGC